MQKLDEVLSSIYSSKAVLQQQFPNPSSDSFWIWANEYGIDDFDELRRALVPLPPQEQMDLVAGTGNRKFLHTGATQYEMLKNIMANLALKPEEIGNILDFGCGVGRTLRYFYKHLGRNKFYGCDINKAAIKWLQNNMPFGQYDVNNELPTLSYKDEFFDLVYSISIFTHLTEEHSFDWLEELKRITKKGATIILTTHGERVLEVARKDPAVCGLTVEDVSKAEAEMARGNFIFIRQNYSMSDPLTPHLNPDSYGFVFTPRRYLEKTWGKYFDIVEIREGALDNWQDAVIMQKR